MTNQLLYLVSEIHESFENSKSLEVRAVFSDMSKAFDKVWHDGLLFQLKQNGIQGKLLQLFNNYLAYRYQRVVINGSHSEYIEIKSGVPQGYVLGPLLFLFTLMILRTTSCRKSNSLLMTQCCILSSRIHLCLQMK